jgi:hypothetical protein
VDRHLGRYPRVDHLSHRHRDARIFSHFSYIFLCVSFLYTKFLEGEIDHVYRWSSLKWYSINIHVAGLDTVYPKRFIPFWKGLIPLYGAFATLGSHIYCLGGRNAAHEPLCDMYKLQVTSHSAKEWVHVSPRMISGRHYASASVLGSMIYVCNHLPCDHTDPHWCEVFDPLNRKWEALPNPPAYLQEGLVIYAALDNPVDRHLFCYILRV